MPVEAERVGNKYARHPPDSGRGLRLVTTSDFPADGPQGPLYALVSQGVVFRNPDLPG